MNFDAAHKQVDAWLTEEGKRGLKGEAETDATLRRAIETVLNAALDKQEERERFKQWREDASGNLERRAEWALHNPTPSAQSLKLLLDPLDGRIVALCDALLP